MADKPLAGIVSLDFGGRLVSVGASLTVQPNTIEREGKAGQSGRGGPVEKPIVAFIEGELLTDDPKMNAILNDLLFVDVDIALANGEHYLFFDAWSSGQFAHDAVEGKRAFRIESNDVEDLST